MSDLFDEPDGATPLDPDECEGLLQSWIVSRDDLNTAERENTAAGLTWAIRRRRRPDLFSESFCKELHRRMFGDVWAWAGNFRQTERNIGVDPVQIPVAMRTALDNARYWAENETFSHDEQAIRFHHSLVLVHPFPNGNGRWSRMMADLLIAQLGSAPFTWGRTELGEPSKTRKQYVAALRAADNHNFSLLLVFARS